MRNSFGVLGRWTVLLGAGLLVACSSAQQPDRHAYVYSSGGTTIRIPAQSHACRTDPQSCMYDGPYEPNERAYAEQRAQELNRASLERLRRSQW